VGKVDPSHERKNKRLHTWLFDSPSHHPLNLLIPVPGKPPRQGDGGNQGSSAEHTHEWTFTAPLGMTVGGKVAITQTTIKLASPIWREEDTSAMRLGLT
jgi:hypothetical protein